MSQSMDLEKMEKESRQMFAEDGLIYLFAGLILLLAGVGFALPALVGLVGFSAFLIFPMEALRRRITYPRVGYARFSAPPGMLRGMLAFALVVVVVLAVIAFAGGGRFQRLLPLAFSIVFALSFYFGVSPHGAQARDWFIIGLTLFAGLITSWRFADWHDGAAVLFIFSGLAALAIGLVKLVQFMRKYPLPSESEMEQK